MIQTRFTVSHSRRLVGIKVLVFTGLLSTGILTESFAACANYESRVTQAVQAYDFDTLERLLPTLRKTGCSRWYVDGVKRSMAQIAAARAKRLVKQGRLNSAEGWLRRAPTMVWETQMVHGEIAARRQQWQTASYFFNQSLDLIADPQATPQAPQHWVIENLYQLAQELQILVGGFGSTINDDGKERGMMRAQVRGIAPKKRLLPIQFEFGGTQLSETGQQSARKLAAYIKRKGVPKVTLIGHTDAKGKRQVNRRISKQRAQSVKKYLQQSGVKASIQTRGKGEDEPLQLANAWQLTAAQIDRLNRRVEFRTD
jgi:outer membrane protein OmpA-like peptidoglycan-associated protein